MFYELNEISDVLNCKKCHERLDEPRILPCDETVCSVCLSLIYVENRHFNCILCSQKHTMPENGFPLNKTVLKLLSMQPTEVYRGPAVESLKTALGEMRNKITRLSFGINNGDDRIKDECIELRNQVQLATEQTIQQLIEYSDELIKEINHYEKETLRAYHSNQNNRDVMKIVQKMEQFHLECSDYLKKTRLSHEVISRANNEACKLNESADEEQFNLDSFIFKGGILKFVKNSNRLERNVLGTLELESVKGIESAILSPQQTLKLIKLCRFPTTQKWKLIYRASRDGFASSTFHSKCDSVLNTLVLIKSTNGNVFGGYTQQDWSHKGNFKSDSNAFLLSFINKDNEPLTMRCVKPDNAIFCHSMYGPMFGINDIYVCNDSNVTTGSCSDLGNSYFHPEYARGSNEAKSFLAGFYNFLTTEIEVYTKE